MNTPPQRPYSAAPSKNNSNGVFTHNHVSKIYWLFGVVLLLGALIQAAPENRMIFALILLGYGLLCTYIMSNRVIVKNNSLTAKHFLSEKSIFILPDSRIYIRRSLQTINFIIRRYDYSIKVVNKDRTLTLNANVNNADEPLIG